MPSPLGSYFLALELGNICPDRSDLLRRNVEFFGSCVADSIISYTGCSGTAVICKVVYRLNTRSPPPRAGSLIYLNEINHFIIIFAKAGIQIKKFDILWNRNYDNRYFVTVDGFRGSAVLWPPLRPGGLRAGSGLGERDGMWLWNS